ncbi:serine/threonine protein kinase [Pelodictyon phaeoclathratiforme]|jgi:serine/threonine-protein kinase|uniref:non-specific serine/threonine protein kinase n=1 Tax=Pelodictyon phaeoclathratiforme (strain DSM 5477 / BU-1) TaxID=324925 RepID=B4SG47_PELPB|nr:serine/threonine-protein kinase [Pelodictyon phaeoclathratiforme]ACF43358.1 serine/threonine protein kinase [Pelodictyon phaeoclathratiforme BU-1]MBV5289299.1 serine/threonine protein kinase [Pelodictyon phaeoclathratiforme]
MEQQILKYRIERELGQGGMSRVYLGVDPVTGQRVAIKALLPHLAGDPYVRSLFEREAKALAKLDHPGIVSLIDYHPDKLLLVQQYIDGMDLEEYITHHRGPIPEEESKELFCKLLEAFAYVHRSGVIHRDIKPANILMTRGNQVKVVDFGIAKDTNIARETATGLSPGTVAYMSPEQIKSKQGEPLDHRTDIYSLGVVLHQMLTGKAPYNTATEEDFEIQSKIVKEPLPRMKGIYEYVSKEMQAIVDKATAKDRNQRYQSCEEFLRAIRALRPQRPPKPDWREWLRDKRVMAGAVLLLLFFVGLFAFSSAPKPPEVPVEEPVAAFPVPPVVVVVDSAAIKREMARQAAEGRIAKRREKARQAELAGLRREKDSLSALLLSKRNPVRVNRASLTVKRKAVAPPVPVPVPAKPSRIDVQTF